MQAASIIARMSAHAPATPLHLLGHFADIHTGAERELPDLAQALAGRRECVLWSDTPPHPDYAAMGVRQVRPEAGEFPRGGMLLLGGVHVGTGDWLRQAHLDRLAVRYNLPQHERLARLVVYLQHMTGLVPQVRFVSRVMQRAVGMAGTVEPSLIRLAPFLAVAPPARRKPLTVGRLSRDVLDKHHPEDIGLYRMLAAQGVRIRLMGATCLSPWLEGVPGVEILVAGAMPAHRFLQELDVFFYRTGSFEEPYGRVVLEAMAAGVPVVASRRGGYAEQIAHGGDGFLIASTEEAFDAIEALRKDAGLHEKIARAGRASAIRIHGDEAIERQLQFYQQDA